MTLFFLAKSCKMTLYHNALLTNHLESKAPKKFFKNPEAEFLQSVLNAFIIYMSAVFNYIADIKLGHYLLL